MIITKKAYIYVWNWYVTTDGTLDPDAYTMINFGEAPTDKDAVVIAIQDITIEVAQPDILRQRKLESLEAKYDEVRRDAMKRMDKLQQQIEELKALPAPEVLDA